MALSPAQAVTVTFGTSGAGNLYRQSFANSPPTSLYSVSAPGNTTPGAAAVNFSFTNIGIAGLVSNVPATFTLSATTNSGAINVGDSQQAGFSGSFSFTNDAAIQVGDTLYAPGSNLLSATFSSAAVTVDRRGTTGSFNSFTLPATFRSDFVAFGDTPNGRFSFRLSGLNPIVPATDPFDPIANFAAAAVGSFSSDPAPTPIANLTPVAAVPEPATWAMLITGFGMAGLGLRRAKKAATTQL